MCNQDQVNSRSPNRIVRNLVSKLSFHCQNTGCEDIYLLSEKKQHDQKCRFRRAVCQYCEKGSFVGEIDKCIQICMQKQHEEEKGKLKQELIALHNDNHDLNTLSIEMEVWVKMRHILTLIRVSFLII